MTWAVGNLNVGNYSAVMTAWKMPTTVKLMLLAVAPLVNGWSLGGRVSMATCAAEHAVGFHGRAALATNRGGATPVATLTWRSASSVPLESWREALDETLDKLVGEDGSELDVGEGLDGVDLAVLFLPQQFASNIQEATAEAARRLCAKCAVGVVGAGVIGGGAEIEQEPAIAALAGQLPAGSSVKPFVVSTESLPAWSGLASTDADAGRPGFLIFADPFSPVTQTLTCLDATFPASVVAGGLSCPVAQSSSIAYYTEGALCRALPAGSLVGLAVQGPNLEMHSVCAQASRSTRPPHRHHHCQCPRPSLVNCRARVASDRPSQSQRAPPMW